MQIWVQYTLDLQNNARDGVLICGGWATKERSYKIVGKKVRDWAGFYDSQIEIKNNDPADKLASELKGRIEKVHHRVNHIVELKHQDPFMYIYEIKRRQKEEFNIVRCRLETKPEIILGLGIFILTTPISMPATFKKHLRKMDLLP